MTETGDQNLAALLAFLDLTLHKDRHKPARQYALLEHLRECVDSRLNDARLAVAAEVRRKRAETPPPRRLTPPILPPAPTLHSRAETEPHNTARLVEESEAKRPEEFQDRKTPLVPAPIETTRRHPKDHR